jgi:proline dehydrogenase
MLEAVPKALFIALSRSAALKKLASRYGMATPSSFARRFIAGERVEEAIEAARAIEARGMMQTLDYLGESVATLPEADAATRAYLKVMDAVVASGVGRNLSLKLTQLGLHIDRASCTDNVRRILERGAQQQFFVRIDMEDSSVTGQTLDIFETLWKQGYREVGIVLQSALYRSEADLRRMIALGARIRLVKGAYKEPTSVAYQRKADVDAAYLRLMKVLLVEGNYPAIATHDPQLIDAARQFARERHIAPDRFEFQMLYGIRRDLQTQLTAQRYRVRVYIPFGREWFPYFMRRLGERPANVLFVLRSLSQERSTAH